MSRTGLRHVASLATVGLILLLGACSPEQKTAAQGQQPLPPVDTSRPADTAWVNGRIYTVDASQPWAEAVAITDGRFAVVGTDADVQALIGADTDVIDLDGAFVMPGVIDIHTHPSMSMLFRVFIELPGTFFDPTEEETIAALKKGLETYPDDQEWVIAEGYSSPVMDEETLTATFLDTLVADRPAYIKDESGHFAWVNTKALELAGVDRDTPDTSEGYFNRLPDGEPKGQVFEGAMNIFEDIILPLDDETSMLAKTRLLDRATEQGITATGDAYVFERDLPHWERLHADDAIDMHIVLFMDGNLGTAELRPVSEILGYYHTYDLPGHMGVKMSMGGAVQSETEALLDGYPSGADVGPLIPVDAFEAYMKALDAAGIQAKVHAIGDGAVRYTVDGMEAAIEVRGDNALRHHVDHCTFVHPDDMKRFAELEIGATAWPMLNAPVGYNESLKPFVTEALYRDAYPNRDMLDAGMHVANHTDAPQANLWVWWSMEAAVTRGFPGKPEIPRQGAHQAITLKEALRVFTLNGAWTLRLDDVTGSIEAGKYADMIVLDRNLFEIPESGIHETEVLKTVFKGEVVFERE